MMKLKCSKRKFEAILRRHFLVDDLKSKEIYQIFMAWREIAADQARIRGQELMFRPENASRLHGVAWWEEYVERAEEPGPEDHITMYLSSTPPFFLPPRFHCPDSLVGKWTLVAQRHRYDEEKPRPVKAQTMVLNSDGSFELSDREVKEGANWCVHVAHAFIELWFRDPEWPYSHDKHILKWVADELTLEKMNFESIVYYWTRGSENATSI